jgi:uncharacterized damage-inducible protein DinB
MQELHPRIRTALVSINPTKETPAWHGCPTALGVLRGVSASVATWRPYPGANNIREIALHIAFGENSVANRLSGENIRVEFAQRKTSWATLRDSVEDAQWKEEIDLLKRTHARLTEALTRFDPDLLDQPVGKKTKRNIIEFIHGVAEHTLYHTAQMEAIKTLAKHQGIS